MLEASIIKLGLPGIFRAPCRRKRQKGLSNRNKSFVAVNGSMPPERYSLDNMRKIRFDTAAVAHSSRRSLAPSSHHPPHKCQLNLKFLTLQTVLCAYVASVASTCSTSSGNQSVVIAAVPRQCSTRHEHAVGRMLSFTACWSITHAAQSALQLALPPVSSRSLH